ncbi:Uncharacterised protein [Chlamydia trachomatis]|nr:Uncharacterised protein [Chlamydia trachomatis]
MKNTFLTIIDMKLILCHSVLFVNQMLKVQNGGGKNLLHTVASMVERAFSSIRKGAKTC